MGHRRIYSCDACGAEFSTHIGKLISIQIDSGVRHEEDILEYITMHAELCVKCYSIFFKSAYHGLNAIAKKRKAEIGWRLPVNWDEIKDELLRQAKIRTKYGDAAMWKDPDDIRRQIKADGL